jgi:hypothetical protein
MNHAWKRALAIAIVVAHGRATAQCLDWKSGFGVRDGTDAAVRAFTVFDDGHGAALYLGGGFITAGDVQAHSIARWSGTGWSAVGGGVGSPTLTNVNALAVFDDGSGSALYAGGQFTSAGDVEAANIARWNGTSWSALGLGADNSVLALCAFDDGTGSALYAGGFFSNAGGAAASYIARWNGTSWSPLGAGTNGAVYALAVFDDGSGLALYAAGLFTAAGGVGADRVARWNGSTWSALGHGAQNGVAGHASSLAVFDDGGGSALYVGGTFSSASGVAADHIARWRGHAWSALGSGLTGGLVGDVNALTVFDDGSGAALYAGGNFLNAGGAVANDVAKWNGSSWSPLGAGVGGGLYAFALGSFDDGTGPALFAGGSFSAAGGTGAHGIARWKNASWSPLATGAPGGTNNAVYALATFDDGTGTALYAGGALTQGGAVAANHIARWKSSTWSSLGSGLDGHVYALCTFDDGAGTALYAGGSFTNAGGAPAQHVARWNGSTWSPLGSGTDDAVRALAVFDDGSGPALYAGGDFTMAGGQTALRVARWKSSTWSPLAGGIDGSQSPASVAALLAFNDGSGPGLFVGGSFDVVDGSPAANVARWDGSTWTIAQLHTDGPVAAFAAFEFHGAPALAVGGSFISAGGGLSYGDAVWDGYMWWDLAGGLHNSTQAFATFDDGSGLALYAAGSFVPVPGLFAVNRIARWDGFAWHPLGDGLDGTAFALAKFDDGAPGLYAGGYFQSAGALASSYIAAWRGCSAPIEGFCYGDGSLVSCPCANEGAQGHGCQNSAFTGGARLQATGHAQPDSIVLHAAGELPSALSIFLQADALYEPTFFGDGVLCANGNLLRLYVKHAAGGAISAPQAGDPSVSAKSAALGDPLAPGMTRYYQTYYRDSKLDFCPAPSGDAWNITNAVRILW